MKKDKPDSLIRVFGTTWCPDCKRANKFLGEQRVPYINIDIEKDSEAMTYVEEVNHGMRIIPTIVFPDGSILKEWQYDGVFVFIGLSPNSELVSERVETDEAGFVITDKNLMTSVPGLFAAGDVRLGSTKQAASAAGEGATAALMIREYLKTTG
jgi:thioredoxin reductase